MSASSATSRMCGGLIGRPSIIVQKAQATSYTPCASGREKGPAAGHHIFQRVPASDGAEVPDMSAEVGGRDARCAPREEFIDECLVRRIAGRRRNPRRSFGACDVNVETGVRADSEGRIHHQALP